MVGCVVWGIVMLGGGGETYFFSRKKLPTCISRSKQTVKDADPLNVGHV